MLIMAMRTPRSRAAQGLSARLWECDQQTPPAKSAALRAASVTESFLPEITHFPGWPACSD